MIRELLILLSTDNFYKVSDNVDIAKGKNKLPMNIKEGIESVKRNR